MQNTDGNTLWQRGSLTRHFTYLLGKLICMNAQVKQYELIAVFKNPFFFKSKHPISMPLS